uniref:Uncharacterized protein n=1 Tax=Oryza punctata TaxID=4537 RepID=A0A0E0KTT9_ORYPU
MRRFRFTIVVEDDPGAGDDGFTEDDLEAAEQLIQLRCSGGRQEEQADDDDDDDGDGDADGDWWGRKRKRPRFRSLSDL